MRRQRREKGAREQALGRSRGGLTTKIHLLTDRMGRPLRLLLTGGEKADCQHAIALLEGRKPDEQEIAIVKEIGAWLKVNGEAIYAIRPWKIYGEGPSTEFSEEGQHGGQADVSKRSFTPEDIRFTRSKDGGTLYAIVLEIPKDGKVCVKSLAADSQYWPGGIGSVRLVGGDSLKFLRDKGGLHVSLPEKWDGKTAFALAIRSEAIAEKSALPADPRQTTDGAKSSLNLVDNEK